MFKLKMYIKEKYSNGEYYETLETYGILSKNEAILKYQTMFKTLKESEKKNGSLPKNKTIKITLLNEKDEVLYKIGRNS